MTPSPAQPIVCPIIVGRDAHLAAIDHLIAETRAGAGRAPAISGEAGMGKSRLVAEASQRAIAQALVVGERTVETHISNILAKLDFTSRRQIAAWAIERGLAKCVE